MPLHSIPAPVPRPEPSTGYQLRVVQEVLLALLAKEPARGYQLRAELQLALGPLADALNGGTTAIGTSATAGQLSNTTARGNPSRAHPGLARPIA